MEKGTVNLLHTRVPAVYRGQGIAQLLAKNSIITNMKGLLLLCFVALAAALETYEDKEQPLVPDRRDVLKTPEDKGIEPKYLDCQEIFETVSSAANGEYTIFADPLKPGKKVYCDMSTKGWTLILQRKMDSDISFHQDFEMYATGFGDTRNSYWLGNEFVHQLTKKNNYLLRVVFRTADGKFPFAEYDYFKLENSTLRYAIRLGSYRSSTAEDGFTSPALENKVDNIAFSTSDSDSDLSPANCAAAFHAGWWFADCHASVLTLPDYLKWPGVCDGDTKICEYVKVMIRREPI